MRNEKSSNSGVFIEIGGGETAHRPSYIHLDIRNIPGTDLVCDAAHLPFASGVADEIYAAHLIEHLSYDEGRVFLSEVSRVLKVGGRFELSCPDIARAIHIYETVSDLCHEVGRVDLLKSIFYGAQTDKFDFHHAGYDFRLLSSELGRAGLTKIKELQPGTEFHPKQRREVRILYELHVEAFKGKPEEPVGAPVGRKEKGKPKRIEYLTTEISLRNAEIAKLETERSGLIEQLNQTKKELSQSKSELENIRRSFGYKLIKFFQHRPSLSRGNLEREQRASC